MIPDGWKIELLGDFMIVRDGVHQTPTYTKLGIPFLRVTDIQNDTVNLSKTKYISKEEHEKLTAKLKPKNGDILYSKNGTIGITRIIDWEWEFSFFVSLALLRFRKGGYSVQYLAQYLQSDLAKREIYQGSKQGSVINLHLEEIQKFRVPIPPLPEQRKIAEILSSWDKAIALLEQLITAKRKLKQGLMQQLLTGKKRFKEFIQSQQRQKTRYGSLPYDWEYVPIGDVAKEYSQKNKEANNLTVLSCSKYQGLVNSLEYFGKQVFSEDTSTYKSVKHGMFAYATNHIDEGSIGYQNLCNEALISPMYTVFKTDSNRVFDLFMYSVLKTEYYRQIFSINTSASVERRGSLRWNEFAKIKIPLPSKTEQQKIASILSTADTEISTLEKQLSAYKQQKRGLMQQLLTGKKRVKLDEPVTLKV